MSNFKVEVKGQNQYDLTTEQANELDWIQTHPSQFHILKNDKSYRVEMVSTDFINRNYTIRVNQNEYELSIGTELDQLIKELGFEVGASKQVSAIKAPMPGLILSIHAEVGQEVAEGDSLLVLEAMKMENNFNSPRAGVIKSILVEKGQAVDKGQLLIEFE